MQFKIWKWKIKIKFEDKETEDIERILEDPNVSEVLEEKEKRNKLREYFKEKNGPVTSRQVEKELNYGFDYFPKLEEKYWFGLRRGVLDKERYNKRISDMEWKEEWTPRAVLLFYFSVMMFAIFTMTINLVMS